jgi:putative transcriptional regulator
MTPLRVRLKQLRETRDLSQQALAELAGLTQATVSNLETGRATRVDLKTLDRLCAALDVEPGELLERDTKKRKKSV